MKPIIVTVVGRKGGCGKSTLITSLAGALAKAKRKVLVADLDAQASATRSLFGVEHQFHPTHTVAALFTAPDTEPGQVIHSTPIDNIDCLPATDALDRFMIPHQHQNPAVLAPLLHRLDDNYQVVLCDTAPNTNAWPTHAALHVSNWAITPVIPDSFGAHSTIDTLRVIRSVGKAAFLGFVLTMVERSLVTTEYRKAIRDKHGDDVFKTEIPKAVALRDATASRLPITHLKPKPAAAKAIDKLANEIGTRTAKQKERTAA